MSKAPPVGPIVPPHEAGSSAWPQYVPPVAPESAAPAAPGSPPPPTPPASPAAAALSDIAEAAASVAAAIVDAVAPPAPALPLPDEPGVVGPPPAAPVGETLKRLRTRTPGIVLDCGTDASVRHVGVAFVHGIGSQNAGEILLEWSGAIVRSLAQLRLQEGAPVDPVVTTQLDPSSGKDLFIELAYPETQGPNGERVPPEHWVLTEAWWAQRVRPPDFARMAEWLGPRGAVGRVITAMFAAQRTGDPRQRPQSEAHRLGRPATESGDDDPLRTTEVGPALSMLERPIAPSHEAAGDPAPGDSEPATLGARKRTSPGASFGAVAGIIEQLGVRAFLHAVATLVLLLYGVLRSIEKLLPIGPLKDGALTRPIDRFVLDWFGDVYVLLGDPAQSESVQERLIDSIWNLEAIGCHPIAIVAHSGGAIVTYLTLSDPVTARLRVDRVVTIGEAANLGWRLTKFGDTGDDSDDPSDIHGGLYRTLKDREHPLVWTDFWASQDPAPVGLIRFPRVDLPEVESIGVWNRLSFREDHGGYWDNDEEFVVPLLRRLAGPGAGPDGARDDFGTDAQHVLRSRKRRERLTILSLWTQVCRALPTVAVIHAYVIGLGGVAVAGAFAASLFNMIPGSQLITDPINDLRTTYPTGFPDGVAHVVAEVGVRIIALALAATAVFTLRAPPERSSTFVNPMFEGFDIGYAVLWRAAVLYLVLQATLIFFNAPFDLTAINSLLLVGGVFGLALADVAVGRALVSDNPLSRAVARIGSSLGGLRSRASHAVSSTGMAEIGYGARVVVMAAGLALVVVIVVSPFVAMAIYPAVGGTVLGTLTIFIGFQLLLAVGKWRWTSWDARERVETMRREYRGGQSLAVAIQITIHTLAAVALYATVVWPNEVVLGSPLIVWMLVLVSIAILIGIGIDVTTTERRRAGRPSEPVAELIRSKS